MDRTWTEIRPPSNRPWYGATVGMPTEIKSLTTSLNNQASRGKAEVSVDDVPGFPFITKDNYKTTRWFKLKIEIEAESSCSNKKKIMTIDIHMKYDGTTMKPDSSFENFDYKVREGN